MDDAYLLLFPLGFLGLHHAYLNRPCWCILYICTFGCLGVGWIIDFFRMPFLVREYNKKVDDNVVTCGQIQGHHNTGYTANPGQQQEIAMATLSPPEYRQQTSNVYPSLSAAGKLHE